MNDIYNDYMVMCHHGHHAFFTMYFFIADHFNNEMNLQKQYTFE